MAFLEGEPLEKKIEAGPLKLKDALDIAIQTARGLEAAHEKKIVHRDIKPANLMITGAGSKQLVTIMDFGLALLADRSKLTRLDETMGTVTYMSPEQTYGMELDHRTDVWSLGVVIYEMVTGQRPVQGPLRQGSDVLHHERRARADDSAADGRADGAGTFGEQVSRQGSRQALPKHCRHGG